MKENIFNKIFVIFIVFAVLGFAFFPYFSVFADSLELENLPGIGFVFGDMYCIFLKIMTWLFSFALILAVTSLVINGLRYIFSSGDPQVLLSVHKNLSWIAIGIVIILLSTSILIMIAMFLGVFTAAFETLILPIYMVKCEIVWWAGLIGKLFSIIKGI
ncbi:MAG: hypothetical protein US76_04340 [Parcubacteria group bacterium GW2011_GWA2_38_13b]|nr:MAG: hypothetical protein US76_04340 [Parcubacteria group bacterium GW2011_GWA2_38_13b]